MRRSWLAAVCFCVACAGGQKPATSEVAPPVPAGPPVATPAAATPAPRAFEYPAARKGDTVDDYHGTKVADPYRWLEDIDSPESQAWIAAENKLTFGYLESLPGRAKLKERLTALWNFERFKAPRRESRSTFYERNSGLQNQSVLYVVPNVGAEPRQLIDPNTLSGDGTVALHDYDITRDGKLLVYGIAAAGSDWVDYHVLRVADGKDLPDVVKWNKFGGASWDHDGKGFYYSRFQEPKEGALKNENRFPKIYHHRLGTAQDKDELIYERPDQAEWTFGATESDDGRWLYLYVSTSANDKNLLYVRDARKPGAKWIAVADKFDDHVVVIANLGSRIVLLTDRGAPRYHLVSVDAVSLDAARPTAAWTEVVPQADATLSSVTFVDKKFIANYLEDAHSRVTVFDSAGKKLRDVELPGIGTAAGFDGRPGDRETYYLYTSFAAPPAVYHYDVDKGVSEVFKAPKVDFDPDQYATQQVFFKSKDGTRVPMFISHKKGIKLDGNNPTLMYGYGGFDVPMSPTFSVRNLAWMEAGGVYALVILRGGGEYGEGWHQAAMREKKQNVFDDFIAAAEFLIADKVTAPARLAITGSSNGGLLVGAVETQRPDLMACALPDVGVMDMLRFQKFTIGWAWASEYGSSDDADLFPAIYAYSPLQAVKAGTRYPATLVTTADHDDRVFPAHSFKFAATMQEAQAGDAPVLIRIETRAGHGAGKPTSKLIEVAADSLAFAAHALKMDLPQ